VDASDQFALEGWVEMAAMRSQWASVLYDYLRAKRDERILREAVVLDEKIYPRFHVHGTVTSRILVSEPRIQNLRKRFRSIVAADDGYRLCYLDYAQFEPAILGVLSRDQTLIDGYAAGDLYLTLAEAMGEGAGARDSAKKIFLSFLYGMSESGIAGLLSDEGGSNGEERKVSSFFSRFKTVEGFRRNAQSILAKDGLVATPLGNGRRRTRNGPLNAKESRWALNHMIQGTASLIFKRALLKISAQFGWQSILLPMHDAVLLQFSEDSSRDYFLGSCIDAMKAAFRETCPGIEVRVTVGDF
jgi:DNA polymerase I-like protein with 3'-5' exonuclease and polymerase domains